MYLFLAGVFKDYKFCKNSCCLMCPGRELNAKRLQFCHEQEDESLVLKLNFRIFRSWQNRDKFLPADLLSGRID